MRVVACSFFAKDSSFCPRDLYDSQLDKHSDLTARGRVTVMAVAADFHRDFLNIDVIDADNGA